MNSNSRRICVITGTTRGLGKSLSSKLSKEGFEIISLSRSKPEDHFRYLNCDLSNIEDLIRVTKNITEEFPKIDLLINNAGTFQESDLERISLDDWNKILQINLTAPFFLTQKLLPLLKMGVNPRIINISSTAGLEGKENQSAYCASKHGMMGLFRALKFELKISNISIHNICTGGLDTDFTIGTEVYTKLKNQTLLNVDEISDFICHLVSLPQNIEVAELVINRFKKK